MSGHPLPPACPSCGGGLRVVELRCAACDTAVRGDYEPCPACRLPGELRGLLQLFLKARGNLREVQRWLGVSYPTTRARMEAMFRRLLDEAVPRPDPLLVLGRLRAGSLSVEQAERLLRGEPARDDASPGPEETTRIHRP